jgi:branched-chain amino acid transport system substrate-binding protein
LNRHRLVFAVIASFLIALPLAARGRAVGRRSQTPIVIGGLFSLTGDGSSLGIASEAALEIAARDINEEFNALRLPYRVETIVEDTRLTPAVAADKLPLLFAAGASFVIGPQSSAEAGAVREYANAHDIILISQGSTASSLAIPGDNLFRLAPNDKLEGAAMAALIRSDGIDTIVPMWRADAGNTGLRDSTAKSFQALGGKVSGGVSYEPSTTDFQSAVAAVANDVRAAEIANPSAKIAIYLASFEEAVSIFDLARFLSSLPNVRWYGGDGVVQSQALLAKPEVAAFAASRFFTAPNVGLDDSLSDRWGPVSAEIESRAGFKPDAYSLSVYDAAWVAALSAVESGNAPDVRRAAFVRNVQRYLGVTGSLALDAAGDRKSANFDFWTMRDTGTKIEWIRTGQFVGGHIAR